MKNIIIITVFLLAAFGCLGAAHALNGTTPDAARSMVLKQADPGSSLDHPMESEEMSAEALGQVTGKGLPMQSGSGPLSKIILWDEIDHKRAAADSIPIDQTTVISKAFGR